MSIERETGVTRFVCNGDGCRANYESDERAFTEAWREARSAGWVFGGLGGSNDNGIHYCPRCKLELGDD